MTTTDERRPLRPLLEDCSWVFDHSYLRAIAEHAPSTEAAATYAVKTLGLPHATGKALRDAVRIRELYPAEWNALLETDESPSSVICGFGGDTVKPFEVQLQTARCFGETTVDTSAYPLLMREFRTPDGKWNSFDGDGSQTPIEFNLSGPKWQRFPVPWTKPIYLVLYDRKWSLSRDGQQAWPFTMRVCLSHGVSPIPGGIPIFWKTIQIEKERCGPHPRGMERIRIIVEEDSTPAGQRLGHMSYEYIVPYARPYDSGSQVMIAGANFRLGSRFEDGWVAHLCTNEYTSAELAPDIRLAHENAGVQPRGGGHTVQEITTLLASVLHRLSEGLREVYLEPILGMSLITDPPDHLIDLLA